VSWTRDRALGRIREVGIIPIVRVACADDALRAAEALIESGIGIAEITMTVPHAVRVIEKVADKFGDKVLLGAGTVLDTETLRAALLAGAEFIVTPSLNVDVIRMARRYKKACFPGALTPTEILAAWEAGADLVKVFPCEPVGGPKYIRAVKGPFPDIELVPTGGVDLESACEYIKAGASAIAVGSDLVNMQRLRSGKLDEVINLAHKYMDIVRDARTSLGSAQ
jgi:2-dehydro-3-deoxyphosphogluconate aldolase/(4S)-4-hydroxy-2-oxoglutarate aldolase